MKINKIIFIMIMFIAILFGIKSNSYAKGSYAIVTETTPIYDFNANYNTADGVGSFVATNQTVSAGSVITSLEETASGWVVDSVGNVIEGKKELTKCNIGTNSQNHVCYLDGNALHILPEETNINKKWHEILKAKYKGTLDSISEQKRQEYIKEIDNDLNIFKVGNDFALKSGFVSSDQDLMKTIKADLEAMGGDTEAQDNINEDKKTWNAKKIQNHIKSDKQIDEPDDVLEEWKKTIENSSDLTDEEKEDLLYKIENKTINSQNNSNANYPIYKAPNINDGTRTSAEGADDIINNADDMLQKTSPLANEISPDKLQNFSSIMYNILLSIGIGVAVLMGAVLGIKFMLASVEGKAQIKEWLLKYAVGCVIVFGAFGIWKLVITILEQIT